MNRVLDSRKISPQTATAVGIAVHRSGLHIGVLYRITQGASVRILHLGRHHGLASEEPGDSYVCWVRPTIPPDRAMAIAAYCRRIWKQNADGKAPYGFSAPSEFFDDSGTMRAGPARVGLTCASFVLAVFEGAKFPLANTESWPKKASRRDVERQRKLLELQLHLIEREHARKIRAEVGNIRYHPLDVAGAGTAEFLPADYKYASKAGKAIGQRLRSIS